MVIEQDRAPVVAERRVRLGYLEDHTSNAGVFGFLVRCDEEAVTWHITRGPEGGRFDLLVRWPDDLDRAAESWPLVLVDYLGMNEDFSAIVLDAGGREHTLHGGLVTSVSCERRA